jgi:hypothetical protein
VSLPCSAPHNICCSLVVMYYFVASVAFFLLFFVGGRTSRAAAHQGQTQPQYNQKLNTHAITPSSATMLLNYKHTQHQALTAMAAVSLLDSLTHYDDNTVWHSHCHGSYQLKPRGQIHYMTEDLNTSHVNVRLRMSIIVSVHQIFMVNELHTQAVCYPLSLQLVLDPASFNTWSDTSHLHLWLHK